MTRKRPPRDVPASVRARPCNLARRREFDFTLLLGRYAFREMLRRAAAETRRRRATTFAADRPPASRPAYYEDPVRQERRCLLQRQVPTRADGPAWLADAGAELRRFLRSLCDSVTEQKPFTQAWPPVGPWGSGRPGRTQGEGR